MLAQILREDGHTAEIITAKEFDRNLGSFRDSAPDVLFVSAVPPFGLSQARVICRKARRVYPALKVVVGFWDPAADIQKIRERLGARCFDQFVTRLAEAKSLASAAGQIEAGPANPSVEAPEPVPA